MIVLETSILSLAFRRQWRGSLPSFVAELHELIETNAPLVIPGIALQELLSGVRTETQFQELQGGLKSFPLLLARYEEHSLAAQIFNACAQNGVVVSAVDVLIAAQTITCQGRLWTLDRDFGAIARCSELKLFRPA